MMRGSREVVVPGVGTDSGVGPSRRVGARGGAAWWAALSLAAPALGIVVGQAIILGRRFGVSAALAPVDVTVTPSEGPVSDTAVELATFGDSAMAGVGVHHVEDSLPVQLAQAVANSTGRRVHVMGYAASGARTIDVLKKQLLEVRRTPDVSVLVIGTNDVTGVSHPVTFARTSGALLDALVALGAPVVMSSLPEFRAMRLVPHPLLEVVLAYAALVEAIQRRAAATRPRVHFVHVREVVGPGFILDRTTMSADSYHPSAAGYRQVADTLLPALLSALGAVSARSAAG